LKGLEKAKLLNNLLFFRDHVPGWGSFGVGLDPIETLGLTPICDSWRGKTSFNAIVWVVFSATLKVQRKGKAHPKDIQQTMFISVFSFTKSYLVQIRRNKAT